MISTALIFGLLTAVGFILIATKFDRRVFLLLLGYSWATDTIITLFCIALGASSGTASGLFMAVIAGLALSLYLSIARKVLGHATLERVHYVTKRGKTKRKWFSYSLRIHPSPAMKQWQQFTGRGA